MKCPECPKGVLEMDLTERPHSTTRMKCRDCGGRWQWIAPGRIYDYPFPEGVTT